jgi:hypothetical protein
LQNPLPIRLGVGGTPHSFARAGALGLPLMVAIIGGEPRRLRQVIVSSADAMSASGIWACIPNAAQAFREK